LAEIYRSGMLVGRDAEQRQLDRLLQQARAGTSGVLVLRGDPGIGKTALVDYAAARAGPMRILRATGIEAETELAFAGLHSLLYPVAGYLTALPERQAAALQAALGRWPYGRDVQVVCMLDDGSVLRGLFGSFNTTAEDSPDRDLILQKPIFYRPAGENAREVLYAYTPHDHEASVAPPCDSFR
jgi:hypothetical protein